MKSKILFFDIDGTILSQKTYQISESTKTAIKQAQSNGHLAFINTGRTIAEIEKMITDVGFDGYICGCGTYIENRGKVLLETEVPKDLIKRVIRDLRELKIESVLEGSKAIYYDPHSTETVLHMLKDSQEKNHFNIRSWDDPNIEIDKFCMWPEKESSVALFCEKYKDDFDFIHRDHRFYEVIPKGYSKGSGIEFLISHIDIPFENTYAFGDGENDLPMLAYAKHSIAMGNAPQEIKDLVSYVTEDVDQNGIAQALKYYHLI